MYHHGDAAWRGRTESGQKGGTFLSHKSRLVFTLSTGDHEYDKAHAAGHRGMRRLRYCESHISHKEVSNMKITKNLGMLLLSIWLILNGLIALTSFSFQGLFLIMGLLAVAAGILILVDR
jgi:hypothetical protein